MYRTLLRACASLFILFVIAASACGDSLTYLSGSRSGGGVNGPCIDCSNVCCGELASLICCGDSACTSDPGCQPPPDCYDCTGVCCDASCQGTCTTITVATYPRSESVIHLRKGA